MGLHPVMNHRAEYLLQVLEKIGLPLMASVIAAPGGGGDAAQLHSEAQKVAALLSKTVQAGIDLGYGLDLGPTGAVTDSVRLALTGVMAPLVGGAFRNSGKTPADADVKKIAAAMQAVLAFAENFAADSDHTDRLARTDPAQASAQYLRAFVPVVNAIGAFSFGQPEQKLLMDVAGRLTAEAQRFVRSLNSFPVQDEKLSLLTALRALNGVYAACHEAETRRIMALPQQQRGQGADMTGLEEIWKNFEIRAAMLQSLAMGMTNEEPLHASGGGPGPESQNFAEPIPVQHAPVADIPSPRQPEAPPPPAENPLAMFAKKPAASAPADLPPAAASQAPPADPPKSSGNPMSFFKAPPPAKNEDGTQQ